MEGTYDVLLGRESIGKVSVERQGLYYRFSCRCQITGTVIYRVTVSCGGHHENLGILIPMGDSFGLTTKLAVKKLGKGSFQFRALPKHQKAEGKFIPVYPDEPFAYITRLQKAFMEVRNGQVGVVIPDQP